MIVEKPNKKRREVLEGLFYGGGAFALGRGYGHLMNAVRSVRRPLDQTELTESQKKEYQAKYIKAWKGYFNQYYRADESLKKHFANGKTLDVVSPYFKVSENTSLQQAEKENNLIARAEIFLKAAVEAFSKIKNKHKSQGEVVSNLVLENIREDSLRYFPKAVKDFCDEFEMFDAFPSYIKDRVFMAVLSKINLEHDQAQRLFNATK